MLKYEELIYRIKNLKASQTKIIGFVGKKHELPLYQVIIGKGVNKILLSGGIHGSEQGGPLVIIEFLEKHAITYSKEFTFYVYPCINPYGYNKKKTMNQKGMNINDDFIKEKSEEVKLIKESLSHGPKSYLFTMDFHEDTSKARPWGFCMWETCIEKNKRIGKSIINQVKRLTKICTKPTIEKDVNSGGVIYYPEGLRQKAFIKPTSLDAFLFNNYSRHTFTIELPGFEPEEKRVRTGVKAITTALKLINKSNKDPTLLEKALTEKT